MKGNKTDILKEYVNRIRKNISACKSNCVKVIKKHVNIQDKETKAKNEINIYKFFAFIIYILISCILIYVFLNLFGEWTGYNGFVITSDSMTPELKRGDIVITKKTTQNELKLFDVVTYKRENEYITHRVYEIIDENGKTTYMTRGDNNPVNDVDYVDYSVIKGIKVAKIPLVGYLIIGAFKPGVAIIVLILFIILYERAKAIDVRKIERRKIKKIEEFKNK